MAEYLDEITIPVSLDKENVLNEFKEIFAKLKGMDSGISIDINTDEATQEAIQDMKEMITEMKSVINSGIDSINKSVSTFDMASVIKEAGISLSEFQNNITSLVKSASQINELVGNFNELKNCISKVNELSTQITANSMGVGALESVSTQTNAAQQNINKLEESLSKLEKQKKILTDIQSSIQSFSVKPRESFFDYLEDIKPLTKQYDSLVESIDSLRLKGKSIDNSFAVREKTSQLTLLKTQLNAISEEYIKMYRSINGPNALPSIQLPKFSDQEIYESVQQVDKFVSKIDYNIDKFNNKISTLKSPVKSSLVSDNASYIKEVADIDNIKAKVNELSSAFNNKTKQIVLEEQQMRSSAAKEVSSLQAILDRVKAIKSGLSEISEINANIKITSKTGKTINTDETVLDAKRREAEARALAAESDAQAKAHKAQAQIILDNERIAKAQYQSQAAAQKAQKASNEANSYFNNFKSSLEEYVANDKAFNFDSTALINTKDFSDAKNQIEAIYSNLSNYAGMSKEDIQQLNTELQKQQSILKNSVSASNQLSNSKGTYIGSIGTTSNYKETEKELRRLIETTAEGTVIFQSFNEKNGQLRYAVQEADHSLKQMNATLDRTTNSVRTAQIGSTEYVGTLGSAFQALKGKMGELLKYSLSAGVIYGAFNQFRKGISVIKGIDDAMTELKKVTDETIETYRQFPSVAASISREIGSTSKDIINSAADWARLGYSIEEATELAKNAAIYVNVGDGIDINTATSDMVSAMKAFNIEAKDSLKMVDKFNEVANNFAVSAGGIGEILKRSSSALAAAGNSIDQTIALGTAMQEVVQDTSVAGTTLKMLALRIRGAKADIEQMGESTDGMAESTSKLRDQIKALTNVTGKGGFDIMADEDTFKSTYEIIQGIAHTWKEMSNVNQAALLELIAGKNRAQGAAALLNNFSQAEKLLQTSVNSMGSAEKENEKYLDSIQGKLTLLSAKWQETWNHAISSDTLKYLVDLGSKILDIIDKIGLVKVALLTVTALSASKFSGKTIVLAHYGCESIAA